MVGRLGGAIHPLHVGEDREISRDAPQPLDAQLPELAVLHRNNDAVVGGPLGGIRKECKVVLLADLFRVGMRVVDVDLAAVVAKLLDDINDARVADVGDVLLEGEAQHQDLRPLDGLACVDEVFHRLLGDVFSHRIVDPAPGEDHLRVVADLLRAKREIVGIDADAVSADEAGLECEKIPLRPRGLEHLARVDPHLIEEHRELVHEGEV